MATQNDELIQNNPMFATKAGSSSNVSQLTMDTGGSRIAEEPRQSSNRSRDPSNWQQASSSQHYNNRTHWRSTPSQGFGSSNYYPPVHFVGHPVNSSPPRHNFRSWHSSRPRNNNFHSRLQSRMKRRASFKSRFDDTDYQNYRSLSSNAANNLFNNDGFFPSNSQDREIFSRDCQKYPSSLPSVQVENKDQRPTPKNFHDSQRREKNRPVQELKANQESNKTRLKNIEKNKNCKLRQKIRSKLNFTDLPSSSGKLNNQKFQAKSLECAIQYINESNDNCLSKTNQLRYSPNHLSRKQPQNSSTLNSANKQISETNSDSQDNRNQSGNDLESISKILEETQESSSVQSRTENNNTSPELKDQYPNEQSLNISVEAPLLEPTNFTYPQIKVKPLTELIQEEIPKKKTNPRAVLQLTIPPPRRLSCSNNESADDLLTINERLANMDKDTLRYIINNNNTIYNEPLKQQARKRLRERIQRQLQEIESAKSKDKTANDLIEDETVDDINLPRELLQQIQELFDVVITDNETQEDKVKKGEFEETEDKMMSKEYNNPSTDLMSRLKAAEKFKAMASKRVSSNFTSQKSSVEENSHKISKHTKRSKLIKKPKKHKDPNNKQMRSLITIKVNDKLFNRSSPKPMETNEVEQKSPSLISLKKEIDASDAIPFTISENIIVLSSSDEEDETEMTIENEVDDTTTDKNSVLKTDDAAQQKCDSENVVAKFEALVLPFLNKALTERYNNKHCDNLVDRLHFIYSICTSEYNPRKISKTELKDIENNLQSNNNQLALDFLLREIDNVVEFQKQKAHISSPQAEHQRFDNKLNKTEKSPSAPGFSSIISDAKSAEPAVTNVPSKTIAEAQHQTAALETAEAAGIQNRSTPTESPPRNVTPLSGGLPGGAGGLGVLGLPMSGLNFGVSVAALPPRLPYVTQLEHTLPRLSPGNMAMEISEQPWINDSSLAYNLLEIDSRLQENLNRRSFLEDMIIKFQKEKTELELLNLDLHRRKFLLLNTAIGRKPPGGSISPLAGLQTPASSPSPTLSIATESAAASEATKATKSKPRARRTVIMKRVKILSKRKISRKKRVIAEETSRATQAKENRSSSLNEELQREIANSLKESEQLQKSTEKDITVPLPISQKVLEIKEELVENSIDALNSYTPPLRPQNDPLSSTQPRQVLLAQKNQSGSPGSSKQHPVPQQPLAIIPPLPPPPPPPESIMQMSYELPSSMQKRSISSAKSIDFNVKKSISENQVNSQINYNNIPIGSLHRIDSPITQIRVYKDSIIATSEDGYISIFNIITHKLEQRVAQHCEAITHMYLCQKEGILYTTSLDGFFKKTSVNNLKRVMQTLYFREPLQSIDIAWNIAFIGSRWGSIITYNVLTNKVMDQPLLSTGQSIITVKATKEGSRQVIVLGCKGNLIYINDAATGLLLRRLDVPEGLNVYSLLLSDGHIYCGTQKNTVYKFDFPTGELITTISSGNGAISMASYLDTYLLVGCYDGYVYVLDKVNGTQLGSFKGAGRLILALTIVGDKVITSSKDNSIAVFDIPKDLLNVKEKTVN